MNGYVSKPVDPLALANELEKWLAKGKTEKSISDTSLGSVTGGQAQFPSPTFDRLALLDRLMGDEELAATVITGFLDDMPRQISALRAFVKDGQADKAGSQAHKIKGACGNISGQAVQEIAHAMEKAGKSGDPAQLSSLMPELESRFERLKKAMEEQVSHLA